MRKTIGTFAAWAVVTSGLFLIGLSAFYYPLLVKNLQRALSSKEAQIRLLEGIKVHPITIELPSTNVFKWTSNGWEFEKSVSILPTNFVNRDGTMSPFPAQYTND